MSKMTTWIGLMSGLSLLFYVGGVLSGTITSTLLDLALNPQNLQTSSLYLTIGSVAALVITVVSTFVARSQNSDFYLFYPVVLAMFSFGWDFLNVYAALGGSGSIGGLVAILLFGPLMLMYMISVLEWWRGIEA